VKIALGVSGCIAAYKAVEVMRELQQAGIAVQVILTRAAKKFVGPLTFEALSQQPVLCDMFRRGGNLDIGHIHLAQEIQLLAVVPATANILGKFAHGIADDFLTTIYLSCPSPVLLAPAMNVVMWRHPAVQANVELLKARGHHIVDPETGVLACGMEGEGKLAGVQRIVGEIRQMLGADTSLAGLSVLITAGPTVEDIDPIRFISNRSSGKMGYALAQVASTRGAEVTLISGPTNLSAPPGVRLVKIRSAAELKEATLRLFPSMNIVIMAAAVADYVPEAMAAEKVKRGSAAILLPLRPTDDILAMMGREKGSQTLIGFAAETEHLLENARAKMQKKNLDLIVANDVSQGVLGSDSAAVSLLTPDGEVTQIPESGKLDIARQIVGKAAAIHSSRRARAQSD
jgi:phosphopantothenoylcysteine decarboxylase/phosphopantothenate--cysteine ligase